MAIITDMTSEGRRADGSPFAPGDAFKTSSGRTTLPYPSQKSEKYASQWLIDNAISEAESRGDRFNARIFVQEKPLRDGSLPTASRESMLEYLFGVQPMVHRSILKPLVTPSEAAPPHTSPETTPPIMTSNHNNPVAASRLAWPFFTPDVLFHIGTLNASHKGTTHNASSLEGSGLSVSTEPEAWRSIARLGNAPKWALQKTADESQPPKLIDRHSLCQAHMDEVTTWAISNDLLEQIQAVKVSYLDDELSDRVHMLIELTDAYTKEHVDDDYEGSDIEYTVAHKATAKLDAFAGLKVPLGNATDIALTAYAQEVLWPAIGADGVWWNDDLDPLNLSAPRGAIHKSALPQWSAMPIAQYQQQQKEREAFDDYVYEQASIAAAETVGPNSHEYEGMSERLCEDEQFIADCRTTYAMQQRIKQDCRAA